MPDLKMWRALLERRDLVRAVIWMLVVGGHNLFLKWERVVLHHRRPEGVDAALLIASDLLFHIGVLAVVLGLLALSWRRPLKTAVIVSAQLLGVGWLVVAASAHEYFLETGSTLDYAMFREAVVTLDERMGLLEVAAGASAFHRLRDVVLASLLLPWVVMPPEAVRRFVAARVRRATESSMAESGHLDQRSVAARASSPKLALVVFCVGVAFANVALVPRAAGVERPFAREPLLHTVVTALTVWRDGSAGLDAGVRPSGARRLIAEAVDHPNLVFVVLESTGARALTTYNPSLGTTPFFEELAQKSLVAERAYSVVPHTSKALVAILCGIEPRFGVPITESKKDGIPARCLPALLGEHGYESVFFQTATNQFESRRQLVTNIGFESFFAKEDLDDEEFAKVNYFGLEEAAMLQPSREWLTAHREKPFIATYLTLSPHHAYGSSDRYGQAIYDREEPLRNAWLNAVRYEDGFLRDLFAQYEDLGLADNTVFVVVGDHGEAFGEHGRKAHDDVIWEEGLHVPLLIHDPRDPTPSRLLRPVSQLDLVPTLIGTLGFAIGEGDYGGRPLDSIEMRPIRASCYKDPSCIAIIDGWLKYIHHYEDQPDQLFDLRSDPLEQRNLLGLEKGKSAFAARVARYRQDLLEWRAAVTALHAGHKVDPVREYVSDKPQPVEHEVGAEFGEAIVWRGYDVQPDVFVPGRVAHVTLHFEVRRDLPPDYKLFVHAHGKKRLTWDHVPISGLYPVRDWKKGDHIRDHYGFRIPAGWDHPELEIRLGFWHVEHGRLAVTRGEAIEHAARSKPIAVKVPELLEDGGR